MANVALAVNAVELSDYQVDFSRNPALASDMDAVVLFAVGRRDPILRIKFQRSGALRATEVWADGSCTIYWPLSEMSGIVDMLRYEKPIRLVVDVAQGVPNRVSLYTMKEPVGHVV